MAKMGRPKAEVVKDKSVNMRATPEEYQKIKEYAQSHNLTMAQVLRLAVKQLVDAG